MDPVSAAQIFAIQLRQRLAERARAANSEKSSNASPVDTRQAHAPSGLAAFVSQSTTTDHEARRALVEQLLANQFGNELLNQARFQQIIDQVTAVLEADPELSGMMAEVLRDLPAA